MLPDVFVHNVFSFHRDLNANKEKKGRAKGELNNRVSFVERKIFEKFPSNRNRIQSLHHYCPFQRNTQFHRTHRSSLDRWPFRTAVSSSPSNFLSRSLSHRRSKSWSQREVAAKRISRAAGRKQARQIVRNGEKKKKKKKKRNVSVSRGSISSFSFRAAKSGVFKPRLSRLRSEFRVPFWNDPANERCLNRAWTVVFVSTLLAIYFVNGSR